MPSLSLNQEKLNSSYGALTNFAPHLEDLSSVLLDDSSIQLQASRVDGVIRQLDGTQRAHLSQITTDVLVFACLAPCCLISAPGTGLFRIVTNLFPRIY